MFEEFSGETVAAIILLAMLIPAMIIGLIAASMENHQEKERQKWIEDAIDYREYLADRAEKNKRRFDKLNWPNYPYFEEGETSVIPITEITFTSIVRKNETIEYEESRIRLKQRIGLAGLAQAEYLLQNQDQLPTKLRAHRIVFLASELKTWWALKYPETPVLKWTKVGWVLETTIIKEITANDLFPCKKQKKTNQANTSA